MRNVTRSAMVATMALCLSAATLLFGAETSPALAAPAFFFGFVSVILWAIKLIGARAVSWKQAPTHWPVLAFVAYATLRYFTSPIEYESRIELIQVWFYGLVYFAAANNFYHSHDRAILLGLVGALAVFQGAYGIWQAASNSDVVFWVSRPEVYSGRASGSFICPNQLAGFLELAMGLLLGRAAFFHGRRGISEKDAIRKVLLIYASLMALAGIVASFSRGGALAAVVGLLALALWWEGRVRAVWQRIALFSAVVVVVLAAGFLVPKTVERFNRIILVDRTAGERVLWWNGTVKMIVDHPWFGTGPGTWQWFHQLYRHPDAQTHPLDAHSDPLHLFSDYGLVGWLIVVAFFGCYFWQVALLTTRKTASEPRSFAMGGSIGVIAILAHSWCDWNLHTPANALLMVTIVGFTAAMEDPRERFARSTLSRAAKTALGVGLIVVSGACGWLTFQAALSSYYTEAGDDARESFLGWEPALAWDLALAHYRKAIDIDASNPEPYRKAGEVYLSQSNLRSEAAERETLARQGIEYLLASLSKNPFQTPVLMRMALAYKWALREPENARKTLEQALTVDPNAAQVHRFLGIIYRDLGEEDKAAQAFQRMEALGAVADDINRFHLQELDPRE